MKTALVIGATGLVGNYLTHILLNSSEYSKITVLVRKSFFDTNSKLNQIIFNFEDIEKFFRYFQIKRNYRDVFETIRFDFVYDLNLDKLTMNNLRIDNRSIKKMILKILQDIKIQFYKNE